MMSAILQQLQGIMNEKSFDRQQTIIDLCAAAYPDIRPWQVENACNEGRPQKSNNLYYLYLSQLLHPIDGHDAARRDAFLVKVCAVARLLMFMYLHLAKIHCFDDRNGANFLLTKSGLLDPTKQKINVKIS